MNQNFNNEKNDQRNLLLALLLTVGILFGINVFFPSNKKPVQVPVTAPAPVAAPVVTPVVEAPVLLAETETIATEPVAVEQNVTVVNDLVKGSFDVARGGLNALSLLTYTETTAKDSSVVTLLDNDYFTRLMWTSPETLLPQNAQDWRVIGDTLTPQTPVKMIYETPDVRLERTIALDNAYMISVTDNVTNLKSTPISASLTGQIIRKVGEQPMTSPVHEGFVAVLNNTLSEEKYNAVKSTPFNETTTGGWMGLTDKYWQTVMVFDPNVPTNVQFKKVKEGVFSAQFTDTPQQIQPGQTITRTTRTFAGAKDLELINDYEKSLGIPRFDLSIDFGWFYFLTKPFLYFLNWLFGMLGNMGVAILVFASLIRIALLPIATKSYESMAKMRKFQPKMKMLQERYANDKVRLQTEMMNLYKREKVNPMSGCLPLFLQIPVFYALYKVLSVSLAMRQAPFFGWVHDLSMPDPSSVFTLFGMLPWPIPGFLDLGVFPILMGLTMYVQQRLSPAPTDAAQAKMFRWMPVLFTFMLGNFAAGLVIYWTWSNILSIAQQKYIMKKVGV